MGKLIPGLGNACAPVCPPMGPLAAASGGKQCLLTEVGYQYKFILNSGVDKTRFEWNHCVVIAISKFIIIWWCSSPIGAPLQLVPHLLLDTLLVSLSCVLDHTGALLLDTLLVSLSCVLEHSRALFEHSMQPYPIATPPCMHTPLPTSPLCTGNVEQGTPQQTRNTGIIGKTDKKGSPCTGNTLYRLVGGGLASDQKGCIQLDLWAGPTMVCDRVRQWAGYTKGHTWRQGSISGIAQRAQEKNERNRGLLCTGGG